MRKQLELWHLVIGLAVIVGGGVFSLGSTWAKFNEMERRVQTMEQKSDSRVSGFETWRNGEFQQWQIKVEAKLERILTILEERENRK